MIRLQDLTPAVYYNKSRDFQFIGRLYDIVLNYLKTNADSLYNLPIGDNMSESLLNLLAFTLGFQSRHSYNASQLYAICSVLPTILKHKGSLKSVIIAVNALLHAEGIKQPLDYSIRPKENIVLCLPQQLTDLNLLKDLLPYILPAGIGCSMIKEIQNRKEIETIITTEDTIKWAIEDAQNKTLDQLIQPPAANISFEYPGIQQGVIQNIGIPDTPITEAATEWHEPEGDQEDEND